MSTVTNLENKRGQNMDNRGGKVPEKFIVNLQGRDFIKYEGLLELGHQKGIKSLKVDLIQIPSKENGYLALAKATLVGKDDTTYEDYGDATPNNCNKKVVPHIIRMASTRAKARTLRDYTNVGMTSIEELGDDEDVMLENTQIDPITDKQKACLQDNFDKIAHLFSSIEDINGLSKNKASELIGKYVMNSNNSSNGGGQKGSPSNKNGEKKEANTSSNKGQASENKQTTNQAQSNNKTVDDKQVSKNDNSNSVETISSGQASFIKVLIKQAARKLNKDKSEIEKKILEKYKVKNISDIPKQYAKGIIDSLKKNTVA
jgi:hypothetical protein